MKKLLSVLLSIIIISSVSGCSSSDSSPFEKKVDYKKIAKDLNEKNMDSILHAVDGYSNIRQRYFIIARSKNGNENNIRREDKDIGFNGVYNTVTNSAKGLGGTSFETSIEKGSGEQDSVKKNSSPDFKVSYSNNQFINEKTKKPLDLVFIFDKLQGIEKVKPSKYTYGLDEPPSVSYNLNEKQFNEIINDDLKIKYNTFKKAIVSIRLQKAKKGMQIFSITVGAEWEKKDKNGRVINYDMGNSIFLESDNLDAKNKFLKK
ncbi:hypothetical protein [Fictibacillus gelatini]|uniref:hypothetical protein n=1 Tax=Fictibacillus gelatini TaxID=225985 RepID=UPI0004034549|nr:hypothetical protein [Fictibacillus gelatini]